MRVLVVASRVSAWVSTATKLSGVVLVGGVLTSTVASVIPGSETAEPHLGQKAASARTLAEQLGQVVVWVVSSVFTPETVSANPHFLQKASPSVTTQVCSYGLAKGERTS